MNDLDRVIHEPARLLIVALLAGVKEADFLWVLRENTPALRFYEALGGKVVRERVETVDEHLTGEHSRPGDDAPLRELAYGWPDLALLAPEQ